MLGRKTKIIDQKYPRSVCGAFIFNETGELFLIRSPRWQNKFIPTGGTVELNETMEETLKREVKEETDLDIKEIQFLEAIDAVHLGRKYSKDLDHLIFHNFKAQVVDAAKVNLKEKDEGTEYKWLTPENWLKEKDLEDYARKTIERNFIGQVDYKNMYLRALADYDNLKKETAKDRAEFVNFANANLLLELLPIMDNFNAAFNMIPPAEEKNAWVIGLGHIKKQLGDFLQSNGIEKIKTVGEKFDPELHEAVSREKNEKEKEDVILKEVKAGYKLHGKVVQAAKVVVNIAA